MSAADGILAGAYGVASAVRALAPLSAVKSADQSVTSNATTYVTDAELAVSGEAGKRYLVIAFIDYEGNTNLAGDMDFGWLGPAGASFAWMSLNFGQSTGVGAGKVVLTSVLGISNTVPAATNGAGNPLGVLIAGNLTVAATAGQLQFRFKQHTSSTTATIVHAGSLLAAFPL